MPEAALHPLQRVGAEVADLAGLSAAQPAAVDGEPSTHDVDGDKQGAVEPLGPGSLNSRRPGYPCPPAPSTRSQSSTTSAAQRRASAPRADHSVIPSSESRVAIPTASSAGKRRCGLAASADHASISGQAGSPAEGSRSSTMSLCCPCTLVHAAPYLCSSSASSRWRGGAWGWLVVRVGCARTPSLISVRDPGWLRIGDMMVDGVFRDAVRPLCL